MVAAILTLCIIGIVAGAGLALASRKFHVVRDPKREAILEALPGTNCGACGYPGCAAMAEAMAAGIAAPDACPSAEPERVQTLARIMGVEIESTVPKVARLLCGGDNEACPPIALYSGPVDCHVMVSVVGGGKPCLYGCVGGGTCARKCPYNAIKMLDNGLPEVDEAKCTACGICVNVCPRSLFRLLPVDKPVVVKCSSHDKGAVVRKICSKGCIACTLCVKACQYEAVVVKDFLAVIDPDKCTVCEACIPVCPTNCIVKYE